MKRNNVSEIKPDREGKIHRNDIYRIRCKLGRTPQKDLNYRGFHLNLLKKYESFTRNSYVRQLSKLG